MSASAADLAGFDLESLEAEARALGLNAANMGAALLSAWGGGGAPVPAFDNCYQFVREHNLRFEGNSLSGPGGLDGDYRHLRDIYEDIFPFIVIMAGAQTGKSAWLMVRLARCALAEAYGRFIGYYFPDKHLPIAFSNGRFKPFLRGNPKLGALIGAPRGDGGTGINATLTMTLAETMLFFLTIQGKTATEGLPMKAVFFDEVRRMALEDIDRAQKRYSAQRDPQDVKVSTAYYPESDIHKFFLEGDQRFFHSECGCTGEGTILSMTFPDCIADLRSATPALLRKAEHAFNRAGLPNWGMNAMETQLYPRAAYLCPKCGEFLPDPREGWWEQHAPENAIHSYQFPQLLSIAYPAGRALHEMTVATEQQEVHNSMRGMPWVDVSAMPIQPEHVDACVDTSATWGEHMTDDQRRRRLVNCGMGVDVQKGYGVAAIKHRNPVTGRWKVVHLEIVKDPGKAGKTWWHRLGQLMHRYDIRVAVIDEAPEFTAAQSFCDAFRGRAFLASFTIRQEAKKFVEWADELADDTKQRGEATRRHYVAIERTRGLHWSLMNWKNRMNEIPPLGSLIQVLPLDGKGKVVFSAHLKLGNMGPAAIGHVFREQLCRFVFRNVMDPNDGGGSRSGGTANSRAKIREKAAQGAKKWVAEFVGASPDLAFANLYADVAMARIGAPFGIRELA